jgi:hypothetical protein
MGGIAPSRYTPVDQSLDWCSITVHAYLASRGKIRTSFRHYV